MSPPISSKLASFTPKIISRAPRPGIGECLAAARRRGWYRLVARESAWARIADWLLCGGSGGRPSLIHRRAGRSRCRWGFTERAVWQGPLMGADPQVIVSFVSSWGAGGKPELPDWRETTRDCGESFAAQPWAERDDGLVVHPREAAELGEPTAVRDRSLTRANGADQMVSFGGNVRKQEPKICLPCLGRRPGLQCLIHQ